jgi:hypothetical protein
MIWRERRFLLGTLGAILLLNVIFFFTYRLRFEERVNDLDRRYEQSQSQLLEARNDRLNAERTVRELEAIEKNVSFVYTSLWARPSERLGPLMLEIRHLATRSGVAGPTNISYQEQRQQKSDRDLLMMTISFNVEGNYESMRRLLNLIELSDQFVIIESVGLTGGGSEANFLRLNITLRTVFREQPEGGVRG